MHRSGGVTPLPAPVGVGQVPWVHAKSGCLPFSFCPPSPHPPPQDAALIVHELGIDAAAVWISVAPTDGPRFIGRVGAGPAEYSFAPTQWDPSLQFVDPIFRNSENYVAQFRAVMGSTPSYTTASGTAAAVALHLAIEAADSLDVEAVAQAFRELREDTFFGPMAFNRYQRNYGGFTATVEIVNGRVEAVLPDTSASVQLVLPPARAMRARCPAAVSHDNFTTCAVELEQQVGPPGGRLSGWSMLYCRGGGGLGWI